tara:strand:+ start:11538 stop:13124 length:1587 start_codon:yes stop_codon:yes gene_type:complete
MKRKFIVVTGGVLSGLGKGIAAASVGFLLKSSNLKIIPVKCDGYLNVDPGTMNPIEHGEVFVLDDGGEVDMDFGHYERFLNVTCKSNWNLTMGKVFERIREKERRGDYLGKSVQLIPHVTDLIKNWFFEIAEEENADIMLIEVGGTVGDIENELYLEAVRQLKNQVNEEDIIYIHLTHIPILKGSNEQKSKPTQQSVNLLRQKGIQPNIVIGRCSEFIQDSIKEKISNFCSINKDAVITGLDVDNIYEIPLTFEKENIMEIINKKLNLEVNPDLKKWETLIHNLKNPSKEINVAICGKYTRLNDSYASILESLNHCKANLNCKINLKWIETTDKEEVKEKLKDIKGIIVPGGFGSRGVEGKIEAIKYARENNIPFLGLCYGMQLAVIEYARNVVHLENANSTEVDENTKYPIVDLLPEQKNIKDKGATMRLGGQDVLIKENTLAYELFKTDKIRRRFRHRYEINPEFLKLLNENGLVFSGKASQGEIMQILELKDSKRYMASQFHPELTSKLEEPDQMFFNFVKECLI